MPIDSFNIPTVAWLSWREIQVIWRKNTVILHNNFKRPTACQINMCMKNLATLPVNDFSSWHLAKSQTFTVLSSEQEQNFKSVLEKLFQGHVSAHIEHELCRKQEKVHQTTITLNHEPILYELFYLLWRCSCYFANTWRRIQNVQLKG